MYCTTSAVHCFTVITGPLVLQVLSSNVDQILHAGTAGFLCGSFGTGNSISLLTLHCVWLLGQIIIIQQEIAIV